MLAIKEIEEENQAASVEAQGSGGDGEEVLPENGDRLQCMGWIIDDFPGTAEQVSSSSTYYYGEK